MLLRAFEALRREVPAELIVIGSTAEELAPLLVDSEGVTALGRVDDAAKEMALRSADLLCAPSLGGESFGMVLTEAFAAGTPVVASDIAGYRDVVSHGRDGLLVPAATRPCWPRRCATSPTTGSRRALAANAGESAERYAWPRIAERSRPPTRTHAWRRSLRRRGERAALTLGLRPADGQERDPGAAAAVAGDRARGRSWSLARRALLGGAGLATAIGSYLAVQHIGLERIGDSLVRSSALVGALRRWP